MALTPDVIITGVVGLLIILGAIGKYLRSLNTAPPAGPVVAGVGLELGTRMQMDQLIAAVNRIGNLIEGKKQSAMEAKLEDILERLDRAERNGKTP